MNTKKKRNIIILSIAVVSLIAFIWISKANTMEKTEYVEAIEDKFVYSIDVTGELEAENSIIIKGPSVEYSRYIRSRHVKIADMVPEGTIVKKGDYVATLDKTEYVNLLKEYKTEFENHKVALEVAILDTSVTMAKKRFNIQNQHHNVIEKKINWDNSKYESEGTRRQAEIAYREAKIKLQQMEKSYRLQQAKNKRNITKYKHDIEDAEESIKEYEDVLNHFTITAPADGIIVYLKKHNGSKYTTGSSVYLFDSRIACLPNLSSMISKVYISETDISKIKENQETTITVDAFPGKTFTGTICNIAKIGEQFFNSDSKVFEVKIKINDSSHSLMPSMTTNNSIKIHEINHAVMIPNECVFTGEDSIPYVYTKHGKKQIVVLGESNNDYVVVEQGLKKGEKLYPSIPYNAGKFKVDGKDYIKLIKQQALEKEERLSSVYHR